MGGIAIGISYLVALGILLLSPLKGAHSVNLPVVLNLLPAAGVIFATGVLDDLVGLNPWEKLVGQVSAACLAYWGGVEVLGVAGFAAYGWWTLPATVLWLVACANAFNLIDGVDGLAAGVGLFAAFTTLAAALLQHNTALALATAPLVGALLAFLRYNFNPASIFLGDGGSLTIGFLLGCFAAIWSQKSATLLGMTAPLMALSVPLLDTGISVVRRFLRHQAIFRPDRNHIHHRLLDRGFSPRKVALVLYAVCGLAAAFSLLQTVPHNRFDGLLLVIFCAAAWVGVQLAGYVEFDAARHLVLTGTFRHILNAKLLATGLEKKLERAMTVDDYWQAIREVGREFGCTHVRMSLAGNVYEDRAQAKSLHEHCTLRIPLHDTGYVNFNYVADGSVQQTVAIGSIGRVLQRSLQSKKRRAQSMVSRKLPIGDARGPQMPETHRPPARVVTSWGALPGKLAGTSGRDLRRRDGHGQFSR